jgi:CheY-like chemotaxis protein
MTDRPSIIFVDDDPNVLSGLRRGIRAKRPDWKLYFCLSGAQALDLLHGQVRGDVIVSDMRMPVMDGAELFRKVGRLYPEIGRIMLSGYADERENLAGMSATHHFLMKPCNDQTIIAAIERALVLRNYLRDPQLLGIMSCLPVEFLWPEAFRRLNLIVQSPSTRSDCSLLQFGENFPDTLLLARQQAGNEGLIASDESPDCPTLIGILGAESVKAMALLWEIYCNLGIGNTPAISLERAMTMGEIAASIARIEGLGNEAIDVARTSALLAHISLPIMERIMPREIEAARKRADHDNCDIIPAELESASVSHAVLSACLVALWGFKHEIVENIAFHHLPDSAADKQTSTLPIVYAAQFLSRQHGSKGREIAEKYPRADVFITQRCPENRWNKWDDVAGKIVALRDQA